jgi:hypothetical protein
VSPQQERAQQQRDYLRERAYARAKRRDAWNVFCVILGAILFVYFLANA